MNSITVVAEAEPFDALAIRRVERMLVASELQARARRLREQGHTLRADAVEKAANGVALSAKRIGMGRAA
jgi:hypothetical protein